MFGACVGDEADKSATAAPFGDLSCCTTAIILTDLIRGVAVATPRPSRRLLASLGANGKGADYCCAAPWLGSDGELPTKFGDASGERIKAIAQSRLFRDKANAVVGHFE